MTLKGKAFKRSAELTDDGRITVHADANTVGTRDIVESDAQLFPELFPDGYPPKKKTRRRRKVKHESNTEGDAESRT